MQEQTTDDGWVRAWLRPGSELTAGGTLPPGRFGIRLDADVELTGTGDDLGELGDQIAAHFDSPRTNAVSELARIFDTFNPGEGIGFTALMCPEVDALARMFALFGHIDSAANVIHGHSLSDHIGETHGYIGVLDDCTGGDELAAEAAEVYVRRLMGDTGAQPADADAKRADLDRLVEQHAGQPDDGIAELTPISAPGDRPQPDLDGRRPKQLLTRAGSRQPVPVRRVKMSRSGCETTPQEPVVRPRPSVLAANQGSADLGENGAKMGRKVASAGSSGCVASYVSIGRTLPLAGRSALNAVGPAVFTFVAAGATTALVCPPASHLLARRRRPPSR